jgi:uncharacterized protein YjiS (DUF1127 family)
MSLALTVPQSRQAKSIPAPIGQAWRSALIFLSRARATRRTRLVVAGLSDAQLRDLGIDRAAIVGNRPAIEVPAGLMRSLMDMR